MRLSTIYAFVLGAILIVGLGMSARAETCSKGNYSVPQVLTFLETLPKDTVVTAAAGDNANTLDKGFWNTFGEGKVPFPDDRKADHIIFAIQPNGEGFVTVFQGDCTVSVAHITGDVVLSEAQKDGIKLESLGTVFDLPVPMDLQGNQS